MDRTIPFFLTERILFTPFPPFFPLERVVSVAPLIRRMQRGSNSRYLVPSEIKKEEIQRGRIERAVGKRDCVDRGETFVIVDCIAN